MINTLYFISFIIMVVYEVIYIINKKRIKAISLVRILYLFTYGLVPSFIYYYTDLYEVNTNTYVFYCFTIIGYVSLNLGYRIKATKSKKTNNNKENYFMPANICLGISILCIIIWAQPYGGILNALDEAGLIRMGASTIYNKFSFLMRFFSLSLFSSYLYFSLIYKTKRKRKVIIIALFFISFLVSLYTMLINDSRIMIGLYLITIIIIYLHYELKKGNNIKKLMLKLLFFSFITFFVVLNANTIYSYLKGDLINKEHVSFIETFFNEFRFIVVSSINSMNYIENTFNIHFFDDLFSIPFAFIPSSIIQNPFISVWDFNSNITGGIGQTPTDIITTSLYELSYIGPFIISFIYGLIVKKVDSLYSNKNEIYFNDLIYIILSIYLAKFITYFEYYSIVMNLFFLIIGISIYKFVNCIKIKTK